MRGSFVFKPPARIGLNAAQKKRVDELRNLIETYKEQLEDENVHDAEGIEELKEDAELELAQIMRTDDGESELMSPVKPRPQPKRGSKETTPRVLFSEPKSQPENPPQVDEPPRIPALDVPSPGKKLRPSDEARLIEEWRAELNHIVSRALAPLMRTLGVVAARLRYDDVRPLLRWKQDGPLVEDRLQLIEGAETVEKFVAKNSPVVGAQLLRLYISSYKAPEREPEEGYSLLGDPLCFDLDLDDPAAVDRFVASRAAARALNQLRLSDVENQFAPAWAFEVMGSGVFRAVLSATSLGAFEAAAAQVRRVPNCASFTLKELICSPSVSDQFAFLVSSVYLLSGDDGASNKGSRYSRNSTYLNIARMRDQLGVSVYTCKIWFESVYARENPLVAHFNAKMNAQVSPVDGWTRDELVNYRANQIDAARNASKFQDLIKQFFRYSRLFPQGWQQQVETFRGEYLDPAKPNKDGLFVTIRLAYKTNFLNIIQRDDDFLDRKEDVKIEMLERLREYRRMLPQRELVYMG